MAGAKIALSSTPGELLNDGNDNAAVNLPVDEATAGFAIAAGEIHDGATGAARLVRPTDVSPDYRLRVGLDSILWSDVFNHAAFNTSRYAGTTTSHTITVGSGTLNLNGGSSTAIGSAQVRTYKSFTLYGTYSVYVDVWARLSQNPQTNNVIEFGLGYAAGSAAPTDGAFFRVTSAGTFLGVLNYNGSESTVLLPTPSASTFYHWLIVIHTDRVEFWQDDQLLGSIPVAVSAGRPTYSQALPFYVREYNTSATSLAQRFEVSEISISTGDLVSNRLWGTQMASNGWSSALIPDGVAAGSTANFTNSAAPGSAALSNTASSYATLGGQWQFAAIAGAETDYALFAYQVPAGSATQPARNLIVRGVRIDTYNMGAASATTATLLQWSLGIGSTAVSLATTDSATGATRAPRRVFIGAQTIPVATPIGGMANQPVDVNLDAPLAVEPGTFFHVILKMPVGTATASQIIRGTCLVNGYFE